MHLPRLRSAVRELLSSYLEKKGLSIVEKTSYDGQLEDVKYDWLSGYDLNTIIDVGASTGGFAARARRIFPNAKIYSFEPLPDSYEALTRRFRSDPRFTAYNVALGNVSGESVYYKNEHVGSSSFMEITALHTESHPFTRNTTRCTVQVERLDDALETIDLDANIMLKMDVQGYEMNVLEGAAQSLKDISVVYSELCFNALYEGQPLFNDIVEYLCDHGFVIAGVENIFQSTSDGTFLNADGFFVRTLPS